MDIEIISEDENNHENVIIATQVLQSVENNAVEVTTDAIEKKKKKGVFNPQWLLDAKFSSFLREYKPDPTKAVCIACND